MARIIYAMLHIDFSPFLCYNTLKAVIFLKKERLALKSIKQDLKNEVGQSYVPLILLFIAFILSLYLAV